MQFFQPSPFILSYLFLYSFSIHRLAMYIIDIHILLLWGSKIWAHDLGPETTFHQQYARGEEITEDRCN